MRIAITGATGVMTVLLAGCGPGSAFDNGVRTSFRENAVESCVTASRTTPGAASAHFDWPRLCGCAIDRYMAAKTTEDLRTADPQDPALRTATQQCAQEQNAGAAASTTPPEGESAEPSKPTQ